MRGRARLIVPRIVVPGVRNDISDIRQRKLLEAEFGTCLGKRRAFGTLSNEIPGVFPGNRSARIISTSCISEGDICGSCGAWER